MEFGQVLSAFRKRMSVILAHVPTTLASLEVLVNEPMETEKLLAPSIISKRLDQ